MGVVINGTVLTVSQVWPRDGPTRETVKTVSVQENETPDPRLKPGENEKLSDISQRLRPKSKDLSPKTIECKKYLKDVP